MLRFGFSKYLVYIYTVIEGKQLKPYQGASGKSSLLDCHNESYDRVKQKNGDKESRPKGECN